MSFRRIPFQFTATDPVERQSELMRRFGVSDDNMLVQNPCAPVVNPGGSVSSPRFQHRLPGYFNDSHSMKTGADSVDSSKQQSRVRVIPIQVEGGTNNYPCRQRTKSGDTFCNPCRFVGDEDFRHRSNSGSHIPVTKSGNLGHSGESHVSSVHDKNQLDDVNSLPAAPRVHNIPVVVEGKNNATSTKTKRPSYVNIPIQKEGTDSQVVARKKVNGPCISKPKQPATKKECVKAETVNPIEVSLKQVAEILNEFQSYKDGVDKFTGVQGDKQYRYLDEMLTRCMLKLDNIETHGNEEVRKARKAAVKEVQDCINDLDSKVGNTNKDIECEKEMEVKTEDVQDERAEEKESSMEEKETEKPEGVMEISTDKNTQGGKLEEKENVIIEMAETAIEEMKDKELRDDTLGENDVEMDIGDSIHQSSEKKELANNKIELNITSDMSGKNSGTASELVNEPVEMDLVYAKPSELHVSNNEAVMPVAVNSDMSTNAEPLSHDVSTVSFETKLDEGSETMKNETVVGEISLSSDGTEMNDVTNNSEIKVTEQDPVLERHSPETVVTSTGEQVVPDISSVANSVLENCEVPCEQTVIPNTDNTQVLEEMDCH